MGDILRIAPVMGSWQASGDWPFQTINIA